MNLSTKWITSLANEDSRPSGRDSVAVSALPANRVGLTATSTFFLLATTSAAVITTGFQSPAFAAPERTGSAFESQLVGVVSESPDSCPTCFYRKGAVDNMFEGRAELAEPPKIQHLIPQHKEEPAEEDQEQAVNGAEASSETSRDKIMKEFGSPDESDAIFGEEKAPKPFRAMMHALEAGDKDLAFQYARRYTRYMNKLKERSAVAAEITGLGAEIEGYAPRQDRSEDSGPWGEIYQKQLKEAQQNESRVLKLNPEAEKLLARAEAEGDFSMGRQPSTESGDGANQVEKPLGESAERALVYERHNANLPVDPQGRVYLYFFLSTSETGSLSMIADVQRLYETYAKDPDIHIEGISMVSLPELDLRRLRARKLNITFPVREDKELATSLGIMRTPAVAVVTGTTKELVLESGHRNFWYLDELLRAMSGRRSVSGKSR